MVQSSQNVVLMLLTVCVPFDFYYEILIHSKNIIWHNICLTP